MQFKITDQALSSVSSEEIRDEKIKKLVDATKALPNGELSMVRAQIADFERRFAIDSERMKREVAEGKRPETLEICQWLMLLGRRGRLEKRAART